MRILTIKWRTNGSRLPSAEEVLIIRPTGKRGKRAFVFHRLPCLPGPLPGSSAFQSRIGTLCGPDGMQLLPRSKRIRFPKSYFPKIQGARLMKKILLTVVLGVAVSRGCTEHCGASSGTTGHASQLQGQRLRQRRAPQAAAPVIKDPAEYNAYVGADPAEGSHRENQRPGGLSHAVSQQRDEEPGAGNPDAEPTSKPGTSRRPWTPPRSWWRPIRAMCVPWRCFRTYVDRAAKSQAATRMRKQECWRTAEKYGQQGLDCLPKFTKPEGTATPTFQR